MPASKKTTQVRLVANPVSQAFSMQYERKSEAVAPACAPAVGLSLW